MSQDENSIKYLQNRLNYVPINVNDRFSTQRQASIDTRYRNSDEKLLHDLVVGLLTIAPNELYFEQTDKNVSIDFGVAGYHTFTILQQSEILMDGFEIEAIAGWKQHDFIIQMRIGTSYTLTEKFTLLDKNRLLETIELVISNRKKPIIHKRYFKKQK